MLIEFCGTPKSGKDSVIQVLRQVSSYGRVEVIGESAHRCALDDSQFELKILWTVFDTHSVLSHLIESGIVQHSGLTIINRGLFDRLAFLRLLRHENESYAEVAGAIEKWLISDETLFQTDLIFLFLSSYQKSMERKLRSKHRSNADTRIHNPTVSEKFNRIYLELSEELKTELNIVLIDDSVRDISIEEKGHLVNSQIWQNWK